MHSIKLKGISLSPLLLLKNDSGDGFIILAYLLKPARGEGEGLKGRGNKGGFM